MWELAEHFTHKTPTLLEWIHTAQVQADIEILKARIFHFKIAAIHGGFAPLAGQAKQITDLINEDQSEQIKSAVSQLHQLCQRVPVQ